MCDSKYVSCNPGFISSTTHQPPGVGNRVWCWFQETDTNLTTNRYSLDWEHTGRKGQTGRVFAERRERPEIDAGKQRSDADSGCR